MRACVRGYVSGCVLEREGAACVHRLIIISCRHCIHHSQQPAYAAGRPEERYSARLGHPVKRRASPWPTQTAPGRARRSCKVRNRAVRDYDSLEQPTRQGVTVRTTTSKQEENTRARICPRRQSAPAAWWSRLSLSLRSLPHVPVAPVLSECTVYSRQPVSRSGGGQAVAQVQNHSHWAPLLTLDTSPGNVARNLTYP